MEAEYNALGGIINLITNTGSDEWHVDSSFYINNAKFSAGAQYGSQLYNGIRDYSGIAPPPRQSYQANLNAGGPLLKRRLWFNASVEYDYTESSVPAGPPLNVQHPSRIFQSVYARLKLTWAPSTRHRISLSASADPAFITNTQQSNTLLGVAESYQRQGGVFAIASWDYFHSQNLNTNLQAGFQWTNIVIGPQGTSSFGGVSFDHSGMFSDRNNTFDPGRPAHINQDDGTTWYNYTRYYNDKRLTFQFDPSLSVRGRAAGTHDAKFGIQFRYNGRQRRTSTPGGSVYTDAGGGPLEAGICDESTGKGCYQRTDTDAFTATALGISVGAYVQDRWRPTKWLTILPGIRFDYGMTQNSLGQTTSSLFGAGPRLGAIFDVTRDQKTIFSLFYGRANEVMSLLVPSNADTSAIARTYQWNAMTKQFEFLYQAGGPSGYAIDHRSLTPPHTDEVTVSLRREIFRSSLAQVEYTYKRMSNIWDAVEINQLWNTAGNKVLGYVNGQPQQVFLYTTPDNNYRTYQGIDFSLESRPTPNLDFYAAYTLSWLYGPGAEEFGQISGNSFFTQNYNARQAVLYDGFLPEDVRHQLKIHASYEWRGLTLGTNFAYLSGLPKTKRFFNRTDGAYENYRSPQGTDPGTPNDPKAVTELRLPDTLQVDLRAAYDFHPLIKQHLSVLFDFFNLFNLGAVTSFETRDVPTYGTSLARQSPFAFQLGARYQY
jgi:hypothetical protein